MKEYREKFEMLLGQLIGISETILASNFMKGLKVDIRAALQMLGTRGLNKAVKLAQLIETQHLIAKGYKPYGVNYSARSKAGSTSAEVQKPLP